MTYNELIEMYESMSDDELIETWNEYCDDSNRFDDHVCSMDELDEILYRETPSTIADLVYYGEFNPNHEYFTFDGYGNLESSDWADSFVDNKDMALYYMDESEDGDA